jgi:hypothetical protein
MYTKDDYASVPYAVVYFSSEVNRFKQYVLG